MARIRSVKPEFWDDEAIGLLCRDARLLYIATWNMADDEGLLRWTASYIKANAFMYDDDLGVPEVTALMSELAAAGLVRPYIGGKARQSLAWVVQFARHQKPNRPQPSKLPPPSIQNGDVLQAYIRRDHGVCHLCGQETNTDHDDQGSWPSLDHLIPRVSGGSDYPSNLRLSHQRCNKSRGARPLRENAEEVTDPLTVSSLNDSVTPSVSCSPLEGRGVGGEQGKGAERRNPAASADFDKFWQVYPVKKAKQAAQASYAKACTQLRKEGRDGPGTVLAAAVRFRDDPTRDPAFTPHPATWLNQGRWDDEGPARPAAQNSAELRQARNLALVAQFATQPSIEAGPEQPSWFAAAPEWGA